MIELQTKKERNVAIVKSFNIDNFTNAILNTLVEKRIYVSKGDIIRNAIYEFLRKNIKLSKKERQIQKKEIENRTQQNIQYIKQNLEILDKIVKQSLILKTNDVDNQTKENIEKLRSKIFSSNNEYVKLVLRRLLIKKYVGNEFKESEIKAGSDFIEMKINGEIKKFKIIKK